MIKIMHSVVHEGMIQIVIQVVILQGGESRLFLLEGLKHALSLDSASFKLGLV